LQKKTTFEAFFKNFAANEHEKTRKIKTKVISEDFVFVRG